MNHAQCPNHELPSAAIVTLGCRLNQAESALIADGLRRRGLRIVNRTEIADVIVVNTCIVTATAARKTRQALRAARRCNPGAFIVLAGCSVELDGGKWATELADLVVGNVDKTHLPELIPADLARKETVVHTPNLAAGQETFAEEGCGFYPEKTRANLKIQQGCDFFCSYCVVPHVRGRPQSRQFADVLREARELLARGHLELVLTGVNIGTYRDRDRDLADLIEALLALSDRHRIRVSSIEPGPVIGRVVALAASEPRFCRFLHVPLQHGAPEILRAMNRRYTVEEYRDLVVEAVNHVPGLCLGSDIIVGFPGEDEATFQRCYEMVAQLPASYLHVFRYSHRPGTAAAALPGRVDGRTAARRHAVMAELGERKAAEFARSQVGKVLEILPEEWGPEGTCRGWSDNYLYVEFPAVTSPDARHDFVPVRITEAGVGRTAKGVVCEHRAG